MYNAISVSIHIFSCCYFCCCFFKFYKQNVLIIICIICWFLYLVVVKLSALTLTRDENKSRIRHSTTTDGRFAAAAAAWCQQGINCNNLCFKMFIVLFFFFVVFSRYPSSISGGQQRIVSTPTFCLFSSLVRIFRKISFLLLFLVTTYITYYYKSTKYIS